MSVKSAVRSVLIVEDEAAVRRLIRISLETTKRFRCLEAKDARGALDVLAEIEPDALLVDWMLPGSSGVELVARLRADARMRKLPIIMLSAKELENDRVKGLEAGADDYIVKPFSPRELVARLDALQRRSRDWSENDAKADDEGGGTLRCGELEVRPELRDARIGARSLHLRPMELALLATLMASPGRPFERQTLLSALWTEANQPHESVLNVHVNRLRRKLSEHSPAECDYGLCVGTLYGIGYRFLTPQDVGIRSGRR